MDDLHNPAEIIRQHCHTLLALEEVPLEPAQREFVEVMLNNVQRYLDRLVEHQAVIQQMQAGGAASGAAAVDLGHALRSPLTTLFGYNHLLLTGMMGTLTEGQQATLQQIEGCGTMLRHAVDQLFLNDGQHFIE